MGEEGLETIGEEIRTGKIINGKIKSQRMEVLQRYRKMNEVLFVVLVVLDCC